MVGKEDKRIIYIKEMWSIEEGKEVDRSC